MLYHLAWLILQPHNFYLYIRGRLRVRGIKNIPWLRNIPFRKKRGLVIISNHITWHDPWDIGSKLPPWWLPRWWAKKEFFNRDEAMEEFPKWPKWKSECIPFVVKNSSTIPVDKSNTFARENKAAVKLSMKVLRNGGEIGIFPQGTIEETEYFDTYFVSMVQKTQSLILLVFVYEGGVNFVDLVYPESLHGDKSEIAKDLMQRIKASAVSQEDI